MKPALTALIAAPLLICLASPLAAAPARLELRAMVDCKPGDVTFAEPNGGARVCFSAEVILDRSNVIDARKVHTAYGDAALITVDEKGGAKLRAATAVMAKDLGQLGIFFDGKLISTPGVAEPITGNQFLVGEGTNAPVDALIAGLQDGSHP